MKRVEVVVEREEVNSTKFDGVKESGSAGSLAKGGRSVSVGMSVAVRKKARRAVDGSRTDRIVRSTPRLGGHARDRGFGVTTPPVRLLQNWPITYHVQTSSPS